MIAAIRRVKLSGHRPDLILVDGNYPLRELREAFPEITVQCMVKGDNRVFSIAAASILAKVYRDRRMLRFDGIFPGYGFKKHAGYGTAMHRQRITEQGLSPIHRRSFKMQL
ncbi:MAG: ribonuclease HII [Leptospiraceae bacterium]|nr:ribonuclease HII [Leptospiraceae bacterium]